MFYVGLDVHNKLIAMCILNADGKIVRREQVRQVDQMLAVLRSLPQFAVCYEASCDYGWLHDELIKVAARVLVAHPGRLGLIFGSKRKNDRLDAQRLAKLLYLGEVPAVHVPPAEVRAWRELINFRRQLIAKRTRAKNAIRALLRSLRITAPQRPGVWTSQGLTWLKGLLFAQPLSALKRDLLVAEVQDLSAQLRRVEQELARFARGHAPVEQLQSIPGVGLRTAEAMVAFLDDPRRFRRAKAVGAYFGLVPCQDQSASANRLGHITRDGSPAVRQLLTEAAWQAIRCSPTVQAYFERIHRNDPDRRKIALVATAHYLARTMWAMRRDGTLWKERVVTPAPDSAVESPEQASRAMMASVGPHARSAPRNIQKRAVP